MASFTLRLMVLFLSNRTFTLVGLMLWPVAWQCSKMRKWQNIRGLVFFDPGTREGTWRFGHDVIVRTTPSSAEVGTPNRSHFQYPVSQYLGEMFCSVFQVFPGFLHFETQKYLHVLFISIKKGKCK